MAQAERSHPQLAKILAEENMSKPSPMVHRNYRSEFDVARRISGVFIVENIWCYTDFADFDKVLTPISDAFDLRSALSYFFTFDPDDRTIFDGAVWTQMPWRKLLTRHVSCTQVQ